MNNWFTIYFSRNTKMGRLRCFSVDIILRYNSRDLNGNEEDSSEFIMGVKENIFWKKTYTINESLEDYPGNSIIAQEEMQGIHRASS